MALGRKNFLFVGSNEGGERAAILYSLVESCKRHDIEPFEYLRDVIGKIGSTPAKKIGTLLPATWAAAHLEQMKVA